MLFTISFVFIMSVNILTSDRLDISDRLAMSVLRSKLPTRGSRNRRFSLDLVSKFDMTGVLILFGVFL